ncbi:MAG: NusG domain II-containing protein [bacterium]
MTVIRPIFLSFVSLTLAAGSFVVSSVPVSSDDLVTIELKGTSVYVGSLNEDRKITIKAAYGLVRIQIKGKRVAVEGAECPDQACVKTGWQTHGGQSIVCEPNELAIHIVGKANALTGETGPDTK